MIYVQRDNTHASRASPKPSSSSSSTSKKRVSRTPSATMNQGWISTQLGEQLFQVREDNVKGSRWVDQQGFRTTQETAMKRSRSGFAMCTMQVERLAFVIGGWNDSGILSSGERFSVQAKKWD